MGPGWLRLSSESRCGVDGGGGEYEVWRLLRMKNCSFFFHSLVRREERGIP